MTEEEEGFLNRWSRRKQEAGKEPVSDASASEDKTAPAQSDVAAPTQEEEFDISTLPPIDSITAGTDIRAFLSKGVPAALTQAALRRAWSADPAIRDYVGLSEYSWDFNAPGQLGFGELDPSLNVQEMVADMFGQVKKAAAKVEEVIEKADSGVPQMRSAASQDEVANTVEVRTEEVDGESPTALSEAHSCTEIGDKSAQLIPAPQQSAQIEDETPLPARRHGSALPS